MAERAPEHRPLSQLPTEATLGALYALNGISGFGPVKFRVMHEAGVDPREAIEQPESLPFTGRTGAKLQAAVRSLSPVDRDMAQSRAAKQLLLAKRYSASILIHGDKDYPKRVYESNNPIPILFVRGDPSLWNDRPSVAVVGSREIREPYASSARRFAAAAASGGAVVVSGFATGGGAFELTTTRPEYGRWLNRLFSSTWTARSGVLSSLKVVSVSNAR